jgi:hypothetical protein
MQPGDGAGQGTRVVEAVPAGAGRVPLPRMARYHE